MQIAALCLKSGNAVLLKGGSEARETNRALFTAIEAGTASSGMPEGWAGLMESRADVAEMLKMDRYIDLIIPRGTNEFVRYIIEHSRIPVMGHADGICHTYVDAAADIDMAIRVAVDGKAQYAAVCNATETLLCHRNIAEAFLPRLKAAMDSAGVRLLGCPRTTRIIPVEDATDEDWDTEYLDYVLSVRVVDSLADAISHVNSHGSGHTDAIVTEGTKRRAAFSRGGQRGRFHNARPLCDGFATDRRGGRYRTQDPRARACRIGGTAQLQVQAAWLGTNRCGLRVGLHVLYAPRAPRRMPDVAGFYRLKTRSHNDVALVLCGLHYARRLVVDRRVVDDDLEAASQERGGLLAHAHTRQINLHELHDR